MFHSARIKLTAWYLVSVMLISIVFSVVLYRVLSGELARFARFQRVRIEHQLTEHPFSPTPLVIDPDLIMEAQRRLIVILILVNLGILVLASGVGYFLAGKTLQPIKEMVDEQNRFVADASHELRTPLTALRSSIEVHLRDKDLDLKQAKTLLKSNLEEVNHLQTLSDALLELTQYENPNGNAVNHFQTTQLATVLKEVTKKLEPLMKEKHIHLVETIENQELHADPHALNELFVILLDNAIKYSPAGSTVHVTAEKQNSMMKISIRDEGVGIDQKDLPHIFDRFYRADKSRSKGTISGYGLGLSIAKKIVETHNGSIGVSETGEKGTVFLVTLPI